MKKYTPIIIVIPVVMISVLTMLYAPSDTTIILPTPYLEDKESVVQIINDKLDYPTSIIVLPDERIAISEQKGDVIFLNENGTLLNRYKLNDNYFDEGAGLLGLADHPQFSKNHYLYVYYTYKDENNNLFNKILRLEENNNTIIREETILDNIPASIINNGGILKFGPDEKLYVSVGDTTIAELSQNLSSLAGKILRINEDGTVPNDNPFSSSPVYSYGHRNIVGITWDFNNNTMYASEAGRIGNDEINKVIGGNNYGWPIEECGNLEESLFVAPEFCFTPSIYPAGLIISNSTELNYYGKMIVSTLKGEHLRVIDPITKEQSSILKGYGKIRDVIENENGSLYILTNNKGFYDSSGYDKILKIIKNE